MSVDELKDNQAIIDGTLVRVEDVDIDGIPALANMADMEAARAKRRDEDERTATKRPGTATKGQRATKDLVQDIFESDDTIHFVGIESCDSILTLNGISGISPDRKFDELGYGDRLQVLQLSDKRHNTHIKSDAVPTVRAQPTSWLVVTTGHTLGSYRDRSKRLVNKKSKNEVEVAELQRYAHEKRMEQLRAQCKARKLDAPAEDMAVIAAFDADDRCIAYLKGLIEIEASGDTDKAKAVRKKELRQQIIDMTE
ncbi:hypothetical protein JKP88DRAFT_290146 [Tribonema minus]|uniref:Uncharacterized protein n=1 Tax=Tribonema minus TaxID=303371 RepID=A0A835Z1E5_9STRA|nr:hypothetical protein JKP88DRAFT_290146 [Tribonema minus]